jgi:hypothetical protein
VMVERASVMSMGLGDAEVRYRCRNAPDFVRANIDARRESRGLVPLWPGLKRREASRSLQRQVRTLKAFLTAHGHRG